MRHAYGAALLGIILALPATVPADGVMNGQWRLAYFGPRVNEETTACILKLETKDGKTTATLVAAPQGPKAKAELVSFAVTGDHVRAVLKAATEQVFEGRLSADGKKVMGVFGNDTLINAAYMAPTELTTLEAKDASKSIGIKQLDQVANRVKEVNDLAMQAGQTKDAAESARLAKEWQEASAKMGSENAKLFLETIAEHPNTFGAGRAALRLLQNKEHPATPQELKTWAEVASRTAEFGSIWMADVNSQIAKSLLLRKSPGLAAEFAAAAEKALDDKCSTELQVKVLETLMQARKEAGSTTATADLTRRLEGLNAVLDKEYMVKVPPFKGNMFAGRKGTSDRAVVMELFTGAQCPPCVAADVAFDVLQKTYQPRDLILIQYHMHIPGPDPMTNTDTEARWKYYRDAFGQKEVPGTPTTLFNGTPKAGGGGPMAAAEKKYEAYQAIIDPMLETPTSCKINASARRSGDKVQIQTAVAGLDKPGKDVKLRLILVEETVRFVGSNKLRFHHQVVRGMPGGADGVSLMTPTLTVNNEMDIKDLQAKLTDYLDQYALKRPFPQPGRPMDMNKLRVIAFVQDDANHEILQGTLVDVNE
jgi:hypothetical protein